MTSIVTTHKIDIQASPLTAKQWAEAASKEVLRLLGYSEESLKAQRFATVVKTAPFAEEYCIHFASFANENYDAVLTSVLFYLKAHGFSCYYGHYKPDTDPTSSIQLIANSGANWQKAYEALAAVDCFKIEIKPTPRKGYKLVADVF